MKAVDWQWLAWQFVLPVLGPAAATMLVFGFLWATGGTISEGVLQILDVSPWALVSYSLTLSAVALRERRGDADQSSRTYVPWLVLSIGCNLVFYAVVVLRREAADFSLRGSYVLASLLTLGSVFLCYKLRRT